MREVHVFQFTFAPPQHFLYFFPEPQGHGSLRPTLGAVEIVILHSYRRCASHHRSTDQRFLSLYVSKIKYSST
jgi:hypothetical protein